MIPLISKKPLPDHREPVPPYFLKARDMFARKNGKEIFIKKIYSASKSIPDLGPVIMAPGIATNANLFRIGVNKEFITLDHPNSFANLLAANGFSVYLYNPGYAERLQNRYVCKYCKESIFYGRRYKVSSNLSFADIVTNEIPVVIDFVRKDAGEKAISWIGFSLGGMLIYSYLSQYKEDYIRNVITIGSPITLSHILVRIVPYTNMASKTLGFEESAFLGTLSQNLVPITRIIRRLPGWVLRYNLLTVILCNPFNISNYTLKILLGKIIEPIPKALETCFADIIGSGSSSYRNYANYLYDLHQLRSLDKNFLFFFGPNDIIASPDSIYLAHEIISPRIPDNMIEVPSAGHVDLIVGKNSMEKVWTPACNWLKGKFSENEQAVKRIEIADIVALST